jgi:hypothetical protein
MSQESEKILKEIHERRVTHRPRWYFLIRNASVLTALAATIFFGALSLSIEETILERGIGVGNAFDFASLVFLFRSASILWIVSTLIFMVLAFLNLRHIKEGYRWRAWWIIIGIIAVVFTFGLLFHHEGIGNRAESALEGNAFYRGTFHIHRVDEEPLQPPLPY